MARKVLIKLRLFRKTRSGTIAKLQIKLKGDEDEKDAVDGPHGCHD